jgi:large subunit ribosomal protein L14
MRRTVWALAAAAAAAPAAADAAAADPAAASAEGETKKKKRGLLNHLLFTRRAGGYRKYDMWGYGHEGPNMVTPLQMESMLHCVDNSNCKHMRLVKEISETRSIKWMSPAVVHRCAVMRYKGDKVPAHHSLQPGDLMWCVLFTRRAHVARHSGLVPQFDKNAGILINDKGTPVGTRVTYAAGRHLNHRYLLKAAVLANFLV